MRAYGTFQQPNPYAGYLGLTLPLAFSVALWGVETLRDRARAAAQAMVCFSSRPPRRY